MKLFLSQPEEQHVADVAADHSRSPPCPGEQGYIFLHCHNCWGPAHCGNPFSLQSTHAAVAVDTRTAVAHRKLVRRPDSVLRFSTGRDAGGVGDSGRWGAVRAVLKWRTQQERGAEGTGTQRDDGGAGTRAIKGGAVPFPRPARAAGGGRLATEIEYSCRAQGSE